MDASTGQNANQHEAADRTSSHGRHFVPITDIDDEGNLGQALLSMPIEHRQPTPATVKLLYGRAFSCAYRECKEPLYREDLISGTWALNSRICHIHARSEGGPRWDAYQSADDNRADGNLLLMCPEHASAIDILASVSTYTPELLRQWKAGQIETYRQTMMGWPLTTAMAQQALQVSMVGDISIQATHLSLAGEGGRALGQAAAVAARLATAREREQPGPAARSITLVLSEMSRPNSCRFPRWIQDKPPVLAAAVLERWVQTPSQGMAAAVATWPLAS